MASALAGCVFVIDQCVPLKKKVELIKTIKANGGASVYSVSDKSTHLVTTQEGFDNDSSKVAQAVQCGVAVVNKDFIFESVTKGSRQPEDQFYFTSNGTRPQPAKQHAPPIQDVSASLTPPSRSALPESPAQHKPAASHTQQPKPAHPVYSHQPAPLVPQHKPAPPAASQQKPPLPGFQQKPASNQPRAAPLNQQKPPSASNVPPRNTKPPAMNGNPPQTAAPVRPPPGFGPITQPNHPKVSYAEAVARSVPSDYTSGSGTEREGRFHSEIESDDQLTQDESEVSEGSHSDFEELNVEPQRPIELNFDQLPKALQDQIQEAEAAQNKKELQKKAAQSSYFNQKNFKSDRDRGFARNWNSAGSGDEYNKADGDGRKIFIGGIMFDDLEDLVQSRAGNMKPNEIQGQLRRLKKMRVTEIVNMFHCFGNVVHVKCYMDKRHIFITYETKQSAITAIQSMKPVEVRKHKINDIRERLKQNGQPTVIAPQPNFYVRWPHRAQDSDHESSSRENWRSSDEGAKARRQYNPSQLLGIRNKSLLHSDYNSSSNDFSEDLTESDSSPHTHDPSSAPDTEHRTDSEVDARRAAGEEDHSNASDSSVKIISSKKRQTETEPGKPSSPSALVSRHRRRTSQHTQSTSTHVAENRDWFWLWSKVIIIIQIAMIFGAVLWFGASSTERK